VDTYQKIGSDVDSLKNMLKKYYKFYRAPLNEDLELDLEKIVNDVGTHFYNMGRITELDKMKRIKREVMSTMILCDACDLQVPEMACTCYEVDIIDVLDNIKKILGENDG